MYRKQEKPGNSLNISNHFEQIAYIKTFIYIIIFAFTTIQAHSNPEYSLLSGNKCVTCHVNNQGGGLRSHFAWKFAKDISTFKTNETFLSSLYELIEAESNTYSDTLFSWGMDFRLQTVRSHKTSNAARRVFPMQASFYINYNPFKWLGVLADYNGGPKIFPGQQIGSASAIIKLPDNFNFRIGYFQPTFGIKQCDMTAFDRRIATLLGTESLIAPYYAESGAELNYEEIDWLSINAGAFIPNSLAELSMLGEQEPVIRNRESPLYSCRIIAYPELLSDELPPSYFGASLLFHHNFMLYNAFISVSFFEDYFLTFQYAGSKSESLRSTDNYITELIYNILPGISLGVRGEIGRTFYTLPDELNFDYTSSQLVLFSKMMILPYLELLPEYRYLSTSEFESGRWAFQIHLYY